MAFKIVKGFLAIEAAVHGLAGSGTELRDKLSMVRTTARAFDGFFAEHIRRAKLLFGIGRRYAKGF